MATDSRDDSWASTGDVSHQLRRAVQAVNASWQRESPDLTTTQFAVLQVLDEHGLLDQKTLGALAAVDRSTITSLLDRLVAKGFVVKATDPGNRRRQLIEITALGRERAGAGRDQAERAGRWMFDSIGSQGIASLVTLLRALADASVTHDD